MSGSVAAVGPQARTWLPFISIGLFLIATAFTLGKPGLPAELRADEAAHLMLATSLVADGDQRIDGADLERLFQTFPYTGPVDLPVRFAEGDTLIDADLLYAASAAPWVALFGANGPLVWNVLLALATASLLLRHLETRRGELVLTGFALIGLSAVFPYLFWVHPTALWVALGAIAVSPYDRDQGRSQAWLAGTAAALLATQITPFACLLPALAWRSFAGAPTRKPWLLGLLLGAILGLNLTLAEDRLGNDEVSFATVTLEHPRDLAPLTSPAGPVEAHTQMGSSVLAEPTGGLTGTLIFPLFERRTGLLPYFPMALLALLALITDRRRQPAWNWLLAVGVVAFLASTALWPLPGAGGQLLGDPAKAALYPALFLFLRRPPSPPAFIGGLAVAALTLGSALVSSLGPSIAYGAKQSYDRGGWIQHLPLALHNVGRAGLYRPSPLGGDPAMDARLWWPEHAVEQHGDELWLLGAERVELFLDVAAPLEEPTIWRLRNLAAGNVVKTRLGDYSERFAFPGEIPPGGQGADVEAHLGAGHSVHTPGGPRHVYRLVVDSRVGTKPGWHGGPPSAFYLGTALTFFGPASHLARDVYGAEALGCGVPEGVAPGEPFKALVRLANRSAEPWLHDGAARVRLGARWRTADDGLVDGPRIDLPGTVSPTQEISLWFDATAPASPGTHRLELDLVYENVAWFADRRGEPLCTTEVTVTATDP